MWTRPGRPAEDGDEPEMAWVQRHPARERLAARAEERASIPGRRRWTRRAWRASAWPTRRARRCRSSSRTTTDEPRTGAGSIPCRRARFGRRRRSYSVPPEIDDLAGAGGAELPLPAHHQDRRASRSAERFGKSSGKPARKGPLRSNRYGPKTAGAEGAAHAADRPSADAATDREPQPAATDRIALNRSQCRSGCRPLPLRTSARRAVAGALPMSRKPGAVERTRTSTGCPASTSS